MDTIFISRGNGLQQREAGVTAVPLGVSASDQRPEVCTYTSTVWNEEQSHRFLSNSSTTDLITEK